MHCNAILAPKFLLRDSGGKYTHTASRVDTGKHRPFTAHAVENDMQEASVTELSGHHTPSSQGSQAASSRDDPS